MIERNRGQSRFDWWITAISHFHQKLVSSDDLLVLRALCQFSTCIDWTQFQKNEGMFFILPEWIQTHLMFCYNEDYMQGLVVYKIIISNVYLSSLFLIISLSVYMRFPMDFSFRIPQPAWRFLGNIAIIMFKFVDITNVWCTISTLGDISIFFLQSYIGRIY